MTKSLKVAILLGVVPALAWGCSGETERAAQEAPAATEAPAAKEIPAHAAPAGSPDPDATEGESPFDGHYERTGTGEDEASLDILQVGPGILRLQGLALWVGNAETGNVNIGDISGTLKPERLKGHFENQDGCSLDILFHAEGLKVENTSTACGGLNVTFDGEYKRTGPPTLGRSPEGR